MEWKEPLNRSLEFSHPDLSLSFYFILYEVKMIVPALFSILVRIFFNKKNRKPNGLREKQKLASAEKGMCWFTQLKNSIIVKSGGPNNIKARYLSLKTAVLISHVGFQQL